MRRRSSITGSCGARADAGDLAYSGGASVQGPTTQPFRFPRRASGVPEPRRMPRSGHHGHRGRDRRGTALHRPARASGHAGHSHLGGNGMNRLLNGMRVVEGSAFVAVPLAGMTLAQMGAEVIRFDRIEGGLDAGRWPLAPSGRSLFWSGLNKGKKSVAVNMRSPEGRELISRIITAPGKDAGMFLTNLRVRGWMDYETLKKRRKDLIMVTLQGDREGRPQVDYTVNPAIGIPHMTGPEDHDGPIASALPAWDLIAGNMVVSSLLAAERHRLRHGEGQEVELALK